MMWRHVPDDELADALEAWARPEVRDHLQACPECAGRLEAAREALCEAGSADIPEPPALYWEAFRRQVGRRIAAEQRRTRPWRMVSTLAAAAALVVAVAGSLRPVAPVAPRRTAAELPAWSGLPPSDDDKGLSALVGFDAEPEDLDRVAGCAGVTDCLEELSDEESQALADALEGELEGVL